MSIQFAKNETVVRRFDYATLGYRKKTDSYAVARSLIVTNKRVIHQDVNEQMGKDLIVRREMPIEHAKFVDVRFSKTSKPSCLVAALILAVLAVAAYFLTNLKTWLPNVAFVQNLPEILFVGLSGLLGLIALINVFSYFASRRVMLACTVSTDSVIQPVFSNTITDEAISPKKAKQAKRNTLRMELDIRINKRAAKDLADGLGAAILNAIEMNREAEAAARAAAPVAVPVTCCCVNETVAEPTEATVEETVAEPVVEETVEAPVADEDVADALDADAAEASDEDTLDESVEETLEETEEETPVSDEDTPVQF